MGERKKAGGGNARCLRREKGRQKLRIPIKTDPKLTCGKGVLRSETGREKRRERRWALRSGHRGGVERANERHGTTK